MTGVRVQGGDEEYAEEDPYITLRDDKSDIEDDNIRASDLLILAAKTEEDAATLEVWLWEEADAEGEPNAYVHHDIMLPAFPLSVAWLDYDLAGACAVRGSRVSAGNSADFWHRREIACAECLPAPRTPRSLPARTRSQGRRA